MMLCLSHGVLLTPDGEQWHLRIAEIFLKLGILLDVVSVVIKEVELVVVVAWPVCHESPVEPPRFRLENGRILGSSRILPHGSVERENSLQSIAVTR